MSTTGSWVLDAPVEWTQPRGLLLVGSEKYPEGWAMAAGLDLGELLDCFGTADAEHARLSWSWREARGEVPDLSGVFLVSMAIGARVPLEEVPRFVGLELTRDGLGALDFVVPVAPAPTGPPSALVDYPEAAQLLGLCAPKPGESAPNAVRRGTNALRVRVSAGRLPPSVIKRSGRRVQFVRDRLLAWVNGGSR